VSPVSEENFIITLSARHLFDVRIPDFICGLAIDLRYLRITIESTVKKVLDKCFVAKFCSPCGLQNLDKALYFILKTILPFVRS
jgi:hypothetical protein